MPAPHDLAIKPVSAIPEAELTAIELQLQRALVAELMQRIAVLEHRLTHAERRDGPTNGTLSAFRRKFSINLRP
jgi:hypothetical protein